MAASYDNEHSRRFVIGHCFLHSFGFNDKVNFGREFRSLETPNDSSDSRSPRRELKSRRVKPNASRNQQHFHMRRDFVHGSVVNQLELLHIADQQVPLSEQTPRLGSESSVDISSHRNGVQLRNPITFSEQAIKNNSMHGEAMSARDRLHEKFKAASLLNNRMQSNSSIAFRVENYTRSDACASLSGLEWENYVRHWLASTLQREVLAGNEKSGDENLGLEKADCPICLDSFLPGEQKIKLSCSHRFHIACLTPWLITHRDCPYCRANVFGNH